MSLLSKLLGGDKKTEKVAKDILGGLFADQAKPAPGPRPDKEIYNHGNQYREERREDSPSGFSWGEYMPAEENQYNYPGTYIDYFEHIFREDFPGYTFTKTCSNNERRRYVYTFTGARTFVVELMSQNCSVKRTRRECEAKGIPYRRFYYDHQGWWNTRKYVVTRIRQALGEL